MKKNHFNFLLVVMRISRKATEILPVASAVGVNWNAIHTSFMAKMVFSISRLAACLPRP
jgi:hypothetical protein